MTIPQMINQMGKDGFLAENTFDQSDGSFVKDQQNPRDGQYKCFIKRKWSSLIMMGLLLGSVFIAPTFGVAVEDLKAPIKDLKETIFGGWMWVPKIGAAVGGCLLAVYNQSIMPLATGAGVGLGIHFYDLYIKADGALI